MPNLGDSAREVGRFSRSVSGAHTQVLRDHPPPWITETCPSSPERFRFIPYCAGPLTLHSGLGSSFSDTAHSPTRRNRRSIEGDSPPLLPGVGETADGGWREEERRGGDRMLANRSREKETESRVESEAGRERTREDTEEGKKEMGGKAEREEDIGMDKFAPRVTV